MSFNFLEVEKAAQTIQAELPEQVVSIETVEFPVPGAGLPDLNIALRLASKKLVVLTFKSPWIAAYLLPSGMFRTSKMQWNSAFGKAVDWNSYLRGQELTGVETEPGDRVLKFHFENGAVLETHLFPARPNWVLHVGGETFSWKPEAAQTLRPLRPSPASGDLAIREFSADWMRGAYDHYLKLRQNVLLATQTQRALSQLQNRLSQLIKIRGQMDSSRKESANAEILKQQGERLKAVLHDYPKNHRVKRLEAPLHDIELDSKISLADNASRLFTRYKKLIRTRHEVEVRLAGIETETKAVTATSARVRGFRRQDDEAFDAAYNRLKDLLKEVGLPLQEGLDPDKKPSKTERKWTDSGIRKFKSKEGMAIWVGRNHEENEELVIRLARGNDIWMHLKGRPGAHVVIQLPGGGKSPSLETLLDGANLAAYYSGVAAQDKVEIDYTFRKYVKRVPGKGEKFLVTYSQNKTLVVKIDQARLNRVMKTP